MSGYLERLTREVDRPAGTLRPLAGSIFAPTNREKDRDVAVADEETFDSSSPYADPRPERARAEVASNSSISTPSVPAFPSHRLLPETSVEAWQNDQRQATHDVAPPLPPVRSSDAVLHTAVESTSQPQRFAPLMHPDLGRAELQSSSKFAPAAAERPASGAMPLPALAASDPRPPNPVPTPLLGFQEDARLPSQQETAADGATRESGDRGTIHAAREKSLTPAVVRSPGPASSAPQVVQAPDEIHIHIGRIEVTAAAPAPPAAVLPAPRRKGPNLAEYLSQGRRS